MGANQNDVSLISKSQNSSNSKCAISLSHGGNIASYKSVSTPTFQDQVTEKESEIINIVTFNLPALKKDLFSGIISSDDYAFHMDNIMEQVK